MISNNIDASDNMAKDDTNSLYLIIISTIISVILLILILCLCRCDKKLFEKTLKLFIIRLFA